MTKGFRIKKVHSLTLGEKMKKLRGAKGVTLQQISRHTKIQQRYLEDLEEGTYDDLPADVYVRGFLRSYAEFFGVNDETLIRLYERERGIFNSMSDEESSVTSQKVLKVKRFIITPRMMVITAGIVLFSVVFIYLYSELRHFVSAPWLVVETPIEGITITERIVVVQGKTDQEARIFINSEGVIVNQDGSFEETISLQNGVNTITVKSVNSFDKESEKNITVYGQYEDVQEEQKEEKVSIEVVAQEFDITLVVLADDEIIFDDELSAEESQTFDATKKIVITTNRGNATFVTINESEYGLLGETKELVEDVLFTADTVRTEDGDEIVLEKNNESEDINSEKEDENTQ